MIAFLCRSIGLIAILLGLAPPADPTSAGAPAAPHSAAEIGEGGGADVIPKTEFEAAMRDLWAQNVARRFAQADSTASVLLAEIQAGGGSGSVQEAEVLTFLTGVRIWLGQYMRPEALRMIARAVAIKERLLGGEDTSLVSTLIVQGRLMSYRRMAIDSTDAVFARALAIGERALGPEHLEVAKTLRDWANALVGNSQPYRARPLYERSLAIFEKELGPEDPDVARALNGLANALQAMREFSRALPLYERSLAIIEKTIGPDDTEVARRLVNMARLRNTLSQPELALVLLERAIAIREKVLGPEHPDVANALRRLGDTYLDMGEFSQASKLYERTLDIHRSTLGPEHQELVHDLRQLGLIAREAGDYETARTRLVAAVSMADRVGSVAGNAAREVLGVLLYQGGDNDGARALFQRAHASKWLAMLSFESGDEVGALEQALADLESGLEDTRLQAQTLGEHQSLSVAERQRFDLNLALSIGLREEKAETSSRAWDALIRSRGLVLDEIGAKNRSLAEMQDPTTREMVEQRARARKQLSSMLVAGPGAKPEEFQARLIEARAKKERAEIALAERSRALRRDFDRSSVGYREVALGLPQGSALVAFARYQRFQRKAELSTASPPGVPDYDWPKTTDSFMAFVLLSDDEGPIIVPLGRTSSIDSLVVEWRAEVSRAKASHGKSLRRAGTVGGAGERLRKAVWDPVATRLGGVDRVFVVPDGSLSLVNLAALPSGESKYLVETGPLIHYLSAERDLVSGLAHQGVGSKPLVIGGPDFDAAPKSAAPNGDPQVAALGAPNATTAYRGSLPNCGDFRAFRFVPLPGALDEASRVASIWASQLGEADMDSVLLTGSRATEAAFKRLAPRSRILHLATHGYFLGSACAPQHAGARGIGGIVEASGAAPWVLNENPLLLSGLALAGANHRETASLDEEDGLLTAEEIAALDLGDVEWAVLSACDTGVGEIRAGEGVFGLRRAFEVAGVGTLIMSLWAVEDEATRAWMIALYDARFSKHHSSAEAVRDASLAVLKDRRARGESTDPFYWGAFVAAGDWR